MTDPIEQFREWYSGPDGKARWISEAESVEGFLARAFQAGWVTRSQQPPDEPLTERGHEDFEVHGHRESRPPGTPRPDKTEAFRQMYTPGAAPVAQITDYVMTNQPFEGAQDPATRDQPGQGGEPAPEPVLWPRMIPAPEAPPMSFGKRATQGLPPSAARTEPREDEDAAS